MNKPFASAADQNKRPILEVLQRELIGPLKVLEFGSGTGQHACHFCAALPELNWQPSDLADCQAGIRQWIADSGCPNINAPLEFNVLEQPWPAESADVCYTANTFHIVSETAVDAMFSASASLLTPAGRLIVYGPFAINGKHTSRGNEQFDAMLRSGNPDSGIRDLTVLNAIATAIGFKEARVHQMPVNNLLLIWELL